MQRRGYKETGFLNEILEVVNTGMICGLFMSHEMFSQEIIWLSMFSASIFIYPYSGSYGILCNGMLYSSCFCWLSSLGLERREPLFYFNFICMILLALELTF